MTISLRWLVGILFLGVSTALSAQTKRPNIVWITSEDNSAHYMKMYNEQGVEAPNIQSLADHGLVFNNAFSNAPVCSAARSTIISGCYGPRIAAHYHRKQKKVIMPDSLQMFPAYLRQAGYYTANYGKEDYNIVKPKGTWDESSKKKASWKNRKPDQPFFYVQNFMTTHESRMHFPADEVSQKTSFSRQEVLMQPNHPDTELFRYTGAKYRDLISKMDTELGEVVADLKAEGVLDDTFIFYYGDHGGVMPGSKGYLYEAGLHVPLVVYIPDNFKNLVDFQSGQRVDGFVSFVDLAPTILSLAGIDIPEGLDGKAFLGESVSKEEVNQRDYTFGYGDRFDEKYDMVRSVRKGKYKYIRSYQPFYPDGLYNDYRYIQAAYQEWYKIYEDGNLNDVQSSFFRPRRVELLFDVEADPFETKDLSQNMDSKEKLLELRGLLDQQQEEMPDLGFVPEYVLIENAFKDAAAYGQKHKEEILSYKQTADLELLPFSEAKKDIKKRLSSKDPWTRYWALNVCAAFGEEAKCFTKRIAKISKKDNISINRAKAAEFLM